jgi:2-phosphoglycerate kinase
MNRSARSWEVLLIGGAAGTGKTSISYRLAREFGIAITEVDDFQVILERMTTAEQQPALHFWRTHPDPGSLTAEDIHEQGLDILDVMLPALEAVIENHLEQATPLILEGDFIHPVLAARDAFGKQPNAGRVRGLFLYEPEETQIVQNFLRREPDTGPQVTRARVSALRGAWLRATCEQLGIAALPARPWDTLFDRVLDALADDKVRFGQR